MKWLIGTKKISSSREAINEDPMLMSTPKNVSVLFKPMRAIIMETLYKKADNKANAGAKFYHPDLLYVYL